MPCLHAAYRSLQRTCTRSQPSIHERKNSDFIHRGGAIFFLVVIWLPFLKGRATLIFFLSSVRGFYGAFSTKGKTALLTPSRLAFQKSFSKIRSVFVCVNTFFSHTHASLIKKIRHCHIALKNMKTMTHSSSSISAVSNYDASSSHQNDSNEGDDSQLFFVTSYSDFDKLGKFCDIFYTTDGRVNKPRHGSFIFSLNVCCTFLSSSLVVHTKWYDTISIQYL